MDSVSRMNFNAVFSGFGNLGGCLPMFSDEAFSFY
jgi:hypothetical protein